MKVLNKSVEIIYQICLNIGAALLGSIMVVITLGITSRYVFKNPYTWTEEVAIILMIYLCYVSSAVTTVEKRHAVADFFIEKAPARFRLAISYASRICACIFLTVIAISAIKIVPQLTYKSPVLRISRSVYYFPVIVMCLFMVYAIAVDVLSDMMHYKGRRPGIQTKEDKEEAEVEKEEAKALMDAVDSLLEKADSGDGQKT